MGFGVAVMEAGRPVIMLLWSSKVVNLDVEWRGVDGHAETWGGGPGNGNSK